MLAFQDFLFASAAHCVASRRATSAYLLEKSAEFAEEFERWSDGLPSGQSGIAGVLFARSFTEGFRPGMALTPANAIAEATRALNDVLALRQEAEQKEAKAKADSQTEPDVAAERAARAEAARLARLAKEAEQKAAAEARESQDESLLNPSTVESIPTASLDIDGRAKSAFIKLGLTTVGDIEAYGKTQALDTVHGVGETMARDTWAAIKKLRDEQALQDKTPE